MSKFRFRKRKPKTHARREIPVRAMIPNIVTMMAAASGITSIRFSCQENWHHAVVAITIAAMLDGVDGRLARLLKATTKLGAELDSLADFVSFGVAPALFIYFWVMQKVPPESAAYPFRGVFWALALFYAMCGAFRLARFNIMIDDGPTQPYWKHFFLGLPAPGGAGLVLTPAIWQLHTESDIFQSFWVGCAVLLVCGILMASRVPTISAKSVRVPAKYMVPFLLFVMFVIAMLVSQFWLTLGMIGLIYYLSIPIVGLIFVRMRSRYDARSAEAPAAPPPAAAAP
jgi:CDP-diacylglycerol--serine O-phosphatidyltransferase